MTIEMSTEIANKKGTGKLKYILGAELLIFLAGIITGIVFIFLNIFSSDPFNTDLLWIGLYCIWGACGFIFFVVFPTSMVMIFRRRNSMVSSLKSFKINLTGPYAPGYKPSGVKKPRFCEYCGYEVLTGERECTECGGPVTAIKSSYI